MFWGSVPFLSVLSLAFLLSITGFYEIYSDLRPWDALPLSSLIWVSCDFSKEFLWFRPVGGSRVLISARFVLKQRRLFTYHQKTEKSGSFILILYRILKRYHDDMDYDDMDCHLSVSGLSTKRAMIRFRSTSAREPLHETINQGIDISARWILMLYISLVYKIDWFLTSN